MLKILYTRASQDSRHALLERMGESGAERNVLLVPDQYSHESERAMCRKLGSGASRCCEVLSFTRLARRLSDRCGGGAEPVLDAGGRMLLLYAALRQVSDSLKFYRTPSRKPAFLNSLLATVDECCSYGVSPQELMELGASLNSSQGDKWQDIGMICSAYLNLCALSAADPHHVLDRLESQLKETKWGRGTAVFIHGFTDFTPQQERIVLELAGQGDVTLALVCDPGDKSGIFETAQKTAWKLRNSAKNEHISVEEELLNGYHASEASLLFLERHLFGPLPMGWTEACAVSRVKCTDPRQEVECAAAEILRLVRQEGYRYRDIAVCARKLGRYSELVESVFERFGIPVFESTMVDVLQKPVLALVTSALAAVAQDYPYEEMFRYLKTDLTGISREERDRLENYVLTWNIRGGTWMRERDWDMHPEGYGKTFDERQRAEVKELDTLRRRVIAPLEKLRRNPDRTGRGRVLALYDFLTEIGLQESLKQRVASLEARGQLTEAAQYRQLWDIVVDGLEQCAIHLEQTELEPEEFSRLFSLVLSRYDVGTIPVSLDRVTVADANRIAHKEVKILFFLGADSASIPACEPEPGLFSDQDRDALTAFDIELAPRQETRLQRELTVAYETCAIPTRKLYLSYALSVGAGEERAPCFLWERLEKLFPKSGVVTAGESRLAAPLPALELAGRDQALAGALEKLPQYAPRVERLGRAARWRRGSLSPRGVQALFGPAVPMSATRLDLFNSCHFSHFLRFGLDAKPRQQARFRPTEYGTFVHEVLEKVLKQAKDYGGISVLAEQDELRRTLARQAADAYAEESLAGLEEEPARFRYLFERMKSAAVAVTDSVIAELAVSDFTPARFELGFGRGKELPPVEVENGMTLRLSGFVDRVDEWFHDGKRYLRVVDYKTGKKSFSFSDVEDGRGLQMLLYLFALTRSGQQVFGDEEIVPAGVLYIPARNPVVNGERSMSAEAVEKLQSSQLRRQGLVLDDEAVLKAMERTEDKYRFLPIGEGKGKNDYLVTAEQMALLDEYVTEILEKAAGQMAEGNIAADPFWHDSMRNACRWCDYKSACHFEECCGDQRRLRKSLSGPAFWSRMEQRKEAAENGDQAD